MQRFGRLVVAIAAIAVVSSCGTESLSSDSVSRNTASETLPAAPTEQPRADDTSSATEAVSGAPATGAGQVTANPTLSSQTVELAQPAIWPASDVVLDTPEAAAAGFVSSKI